MGGIKVLLILIVLVALFIWGRNEGWFHNSARHDIKEGIQDAGDDLKSLGRDTAHSIRRAVQ
jgi:hypothetical protein